MSYIVTTKFNTKTWTENCKYRNEKNIRCIYGSPCEFPQKVDYGALAFVLEMNNDMNVIEGIGLIKNMPCGKQHNIYKDMNYNRHIYKSKYRLRRDELLKSDDKCTLLNILEYIVFYEKNHLKRGSGFALLNQELINKKSHEEIKKIKLPKIIQMLKRIFKVEFNNNNNNNNI